MSFFPNQIEPAVGSSNLRMSRPVVVLPHPDSPTSPKVSPELMTKSIPSTAFTTATVLSKAKPLAMGKCFFRFSILRNGSDILPAPDDMIIGELNLPRKLLRGALIQSVGAAG